MPSRVSPHHAIVASFMAAWVVSACADDPVVAPPEPGFTVEATAEPDTIPPELRSLFIAPHRTSVDASSREIRIVVTATDAGTGAHVMFLTLSSPSGIHRTSCSEFNNDASGSVPTVWRCTATIPQFAEPGEWSVTSLTIRDRLDNELSFDEDELRAAGYRVTVQVTSRTPDVTAPQIASLTMAPAAVDVTDGPATIEFHATLTDDVSGVAWAQFNLISPSGSQAAWCDSMTFALGDGLSGEWSCSPTIEQFAEAGEWRVHRFWIRDETGNLREYTTQALEAEGWPTRLMVTSGAGDAEPPTLLDISISPDSIDLGDGSQFVELSVTAADAGVGVDNVIVFLRQPDDNSGGGCIGRSPVEGDRSNGTFRCSIPIAAESLPGEWKVFDIFIEDAVGNSVFFETEDLEAAGFDVTLVVTG